MLQRREFLNLSLIIGLGTMLPLHAVADVVRDLKTTGEYSGPLLDRVLDLFSDLLAKRISQREFLRAVRARYADIDLAHELNSFSQESDSKILQIHKTKVRAPGRKRHLKMQLFFLEAGEAHPPHAHEGLASYQSLVAGRLHLAEFERLGTSEYYIEVREADRRILTESQVFETADNWRNVHWFGATEPSVLFNLNVVDAAFDSGANDESRIYLDPTVGREGEGIVAPKISRGEGHAKFSRFIPSIS